MTESDMRKRSGTQAAPKLHDVRLGGDTIRFELRRSARRTRTINIRVEGDRVVLAVPVRTPLSEARDIVRKRATWILDHLARTPVQPPQLLVEGRGELPFMGRSVPVMVEPSAVRSAAARLVDDTLRVNVPPALDAELRDESARHAVVEWLRVQAAEKLPVEVERWWPRLGTGEHARVRIGNQRRQWGNCSAEGVIRFSWRVMMLEPELIEYVVVHEMAHLTRMDHSKEYWALVARAMPDAADRRRRLREVQDTLPL
ncbi:MAG: SprT family zinc-dependent metalloprotease [Chloroflexota bacterium]|nr:SprT family zinc-dependent metalloprotease [Chloroflexota bacterium]MDE2942021.1 SprT family zinc-dependent metalloprotease [Chloroflexota bacterium]MDE3267119.1 SprT family zinc-dependent metalloprotease [Chloroflexota bacterium]